MSYIDLQIQIGLGPGKQDVTIRIDNPAQTESLQALRRKTAQIAKVDAKRCNLIFNGARLSNYEESLTQSGITHQSRLICIISSDKALKDQTAEERSYSNLGMQRADPAQLETALTCTFNTRPFGFAVWANSRGYNAVVTKVAGSNALDMGIKIGYVVKTCNGHSVYGVQHDQVLSILKATACPITLEFGDLGEEYVCKFASKPLGFTVIQDREKNNAKVSKINTGETQNKGVRIGSYLVRVNDINTFGVTHKGIINVINEAEFPIDITFRHPPHLLMVSRRKK